MKLEEKYKVEIVKAGILSAQTGQEIFIQANKALVLKHQVQDYVLSVLNKDEKLIIKDNAGNILNKEEVKTNKKSKLIQEFEDTSREVL